MHEISFRSQCRVRDCANEKIAGTQACRQHQNQWRTHTARFASQSLSGFTRMVRRTEEENRPWLPPLQRNTQRHDTAAREPGQSVNYFTPSRMYCVETICAPCGVVIAWAKFAKAESPTNILRFLQQVYPTEDSRPAYVAIDKACMVMRTSISNGSWDMWNKTTRFIVDSYHYINHRTTDYLCRKWCNPAPLNGSAPNLVIVEYDNEGIPHYKRAFNTQVSSDLVTNCSNRFDLQACEQLNAWLGGFESILKRMTSSNFNWFLHVMLFLHTEHVLKKQQDEMERMNEDSSSDEDEDEDEDDTDDS
jgi:hypothetical protein